MDEAAALRGRLEERAIKGVGYLVDPVTEDIYKDSNGQLKRMGNMRDEEITGIAPPASGKRDLFESLDSYLKVNRKHVEEVFAAVATDGDQRLASHELQTLIDQVLPGGCTPGERRYFQILMDFDGDDFVTLEELLLGIEDCRQAKMEIDLHDVLGRLQFTMEDTGTSLAEEFRRADLDGSGFLEYREITALLRRIFPALTDREMRRAIMHVQRLDTTNDGRISLEELRAALDAAAAGSPLPARDPRVELSIDEDPLQRSSLSDPSVLRGSQTAAHGLDELRVWKLQQLTVKGQDFLVDPDTRMAYRISERTGFPVIVGELCGTTVLLSRGARDLFRELDNYLKSQSLQLRRVFSDFDNDGNERLDADELGRLLARVLPGCTATEQQYFTVMLDIEGRGSIAYDRFVQSIADCQKLGSRRSSRRQVGEEDAMVSLHDALKRQNASLHQLFSSLDESRTGKLDFRALICLVGSIAPHFENRDLRYCLAQFQAADADGDGALTEQQVAQCLHMVRVETVTDAVKSTGSRCDPPLPWRLEKHMIGGTEYLVDPETQGVYTVSAITRAPFPRGRLEGPAVIAQGNGRRDLWVALDEYLRTNKVTLQDTFNEFDADKGGSLDAYELHKLLDRILPGTTANEGLYFSTMMDIDGDGAVTFHEMMACLRECKYILGAGSTEEVERLMVSLHDYVEDNHISLKKVVDEFDLHRMGAVNYRQLTLLLAALLPSLDKADLRRVLGHFQIMDVNNDGRIDYSELMHALGFVVLDVATEVVTTAAASTPVMRQAGSSADVAVEWRLEPRTIHGVEYLVDEERGLLYKMSTKTGQPILRGKLDGVGKIMTSRGQVLFNSLDEYLKQKRARLKEVFDKFDTDASGALERKELGRLLRAIKPECSQADMRFFSTMLDIDGDGAVTFEEMVETLRECKRIATAAVQTEDISDLECVIELINDHVRQSNQSLLTVFESLDRDGSGFLEAPELATLLRTLMPSLKRKQVRTIMSYFHDIDVNNDGRISYPELAKALFFAKVSVTPRPADALAPPETPRERPHDSTAASPPALSPRARHPDVARAQEAMRKSSARTSSEPGMGRKKTSFASLSATSKRAVSVSGADAGLMSVDAPRWKMLERIFNEKPYMIDPETSRVYTSIDGSPPILIGKMALGVLKTDCQPPDVISSLSAAVRERSDRLKGLFTKYDLDLSGELDTAELASLLTTFMPGITIPEARFCQVFLDPECKGTVSLEGLRRAVGSNASVYGKTEALLRSASAVVRAIAEQVIEGGLSPKGEFERMDEEMSGKLTLPAAARLLHKLAPDLSADERTAAHAYLYFCDFERTGVYSFAQLMQAFGVVRLLVERSEREKRVLARRKSRASMRNLVAASTEEVVWKLVAERIKGEPFWVDRETNLVYRPPPGGASGGQWPELYGKLTGVDMINANYMPQDLFQGLDRYLKERKMQLELLFKKFDWNQSGTLDTSELSNLLLDMMPAATDHECNYFRVMMNITGSEEKLTYQGFLQAVGECREAAKAVTQQDARVATLLRKVAERTQAKNLDIMEIFCSYDMDCDDQLEIWEVNSMLQALLPASTVTEKRIMLAQVSQWDLDRSGRASYSEVMRALRLAKIRIMGNKAAVAKASKASKLLADWSLKLVMVSGVPMLLDRQMGLAFRESQHDGYPMLAGSVANGELVRGGHELQLFAQLEPFLAERKVRLREAFSQVDWNGSGSIRSADYLLFLRELLPTATHGDQIFFEAMLDAGQHRGSVTYTELLEALHECLRITMAVSSGSEQVLNNLEQLLINFSSAVTDAMLDPATMFQEADAADAGFLTFQELAALLLARQPGLSATQMRFMVTHMRSWDRHDQGKMALTDFVRAFRLTNVKIERDGAGAGGASRQASESGLMPNLYSGTSFNPGSVAEKHRSLSSSGLSDSSPLRASYPSVSPPASPSRLSVMRSQSGTRSVSGVSISWDSGRQAAANLGGSARLSAIFEASPGPSFKSYSCDGGARTSSVSGPVRSASKAGVGGGGRPGQRLSSFAGTAVGRGARERVGRRSASVTWVGGQPMAAVPGVGADSPMEWHLEEALVEGEVYLYDPGTEFLYLPAQRTDYPEFVGRAYSARGGGIHAEHNLLRLERRANWGDIFQTLVELVRMNKQYVNELFRKYDYDRTNTLDTNEVYQFLKALVPQASSADTVYFRVMMGMEEDEVIDFNGLLDGIAASSQVGDAVRRKEDGTVDGLISKLGASVATKRLDAAAVFAEADRGRTGALDFVQARAAMRCLLPSLTEHQMRYLLCHLHYQDLDGSGQITLKQFVTGLRLATVCIRFLGETEAERLDGIGAQRAEGSRPAPPQLASRPVHRSSSGVGAFAGRAYSSGGAFMGRSDSSGGAFAGRASSSGGAFVGRSDSSGGAFMGRASSSGGAFMGRSDSSGGAFTGRADSSGGAFSGRAGSIGGAYAGRASSSSSAFGAAVPAELRRSGHAHLMDWEHDWELETRQLGDQTVLLDPQDHKVFEVAADNESYPVPAGYLLQTGEVEDLRRPRDIFTELSFLVQEKRTTLRSLLDQHNSGVALSRSDLAGVLDSLIRNVTEPELHYFQLMVDVDEVGHVTVDEAVRRLDECARVATDVYSRGSQELQEILQRLGLHVLNARVSVFTAVKKFADAGSGSGSDKRVPVLRQGDLLRALSPGLTDREVRFLLASLSEWDVSASGFATYRDVLHALRLSKIAVFDPTPGGGRVPSQDYMCLENFRPPASNMKEAARSEQRSEQLQRVQHLVWPLTRLIADRHEYFLDERTDKVYKPGFSQYPQLYGRLDQDRVVSLALRDEGGNMLLELGKMVRARRVNLRQLFSTLNDGRSSGELQAKQLQQLLRRAINRAQPKDLVYFQAMIDITGAGRLSYETLSGALEDSLVSVQHVLSRPAAAEELMEDLQEGMESEGVSLRHLWDKADPKRRGYLDYGEVASLMRRACANVNNHQLRTIVHQCFAHDTKAAGGVTYMELLQVLHLADVDIHPTPILLSELTPGKEKAARRGGASEEKTQHGAEPVADARGAEAMIGGAFGQDVRLSAEWEQRTNPAASDAAARRSNRVRSASGSGIAARGPGQSVRATSHMGSSPPRGRAAAGADLGSGHRLETTIDPHNDAIIMAGGASLAGQSASGSGTTSSAASAPARQGDVARQTMDHANGASRHVQRMCPPWVARRQMLKVGAHNGLSATVVTPDGQAVSGILREVEYSPGVVVRPHVIDRDGGSRDAFTHSHWDLIDQMSQPGAKAQWRKSGKRASKGSASVSGGAGGTGSTAASTQRTHPKDFSSRQAWNDFLNPPVRFLSAKGEVHSAAPKRSAGSQRSAPAPGRSRAVSESASFRTPSMPYELEEEDDDDDDVYLQGASRARAHHAGKKGSEPPRGRGRGRIADVGDSAIKSFPSAAPDRRPPHLELPSGASSDASISPKQRRSQTAGSGPGSPVHSMSPKRHVGREALYREARRRSGATSSSGGVVAERDPFEPGGELEHLRDMRESVESVHMEHADTTFHKHHF